MSAAAAGKPTKIKVGVYVWRPHLDITQSHSFLVGSTTGGPTGIFGTVEVDPRTPLDRFRDIISTIKDGKIRKRRPWFAEAMGSI